MKKKGLLFSSTLLLASALITTAHAAPVQWSAAAGGNDHWYDVVFDNSEGGWWSWDEANILAASSSYNDGGTLLQGHLVTFTSASELDFVITSTDIWGPSGSSIYSHHYWLGGYQTPTGEPENSVGNMPADNWHWVTGEEWNYTNWSGGEADNRGLYNAVANYLTMSATVFDQGYWHDWNVSANPGPNRSVAYVVEYENGLAPIPEPASLFLFGTGIASFASLRLRKKRK